MTLFQLISTKYNNTPNGPCVLMYGRDSEGHFIEYPVYGFRPYFFVQATDAELAKELLSEFPEVTDIFEEYRFLPIGFQKEPIEVLQIYVNRPGDVPKIRDSINGHPAIKQIFEADVLFATQRFLTNYDLYGMKWVEASGDKLTCRHDILDNAPLRYLGFDIEVCPPEFGVPDSKKDPIIIVSVSFNDGKTLVLIAKDGPSTNGLLYCGSEKQLLETFQDLFLDYNPDVVMTFNGHSFDFPYIEKRLEVLKIDNKFGRDGSPFVIREFGSVKEANITGRACIDLLDSIKSNYSLSSYSLSNVSKELLKRQKLDVKASEMRNIWLGNDTKKLNEFLEYAGRDADLLQDIASQLKLLDRYINLSKECGLLLHEVINGGQSRRIESMLLKEFYKEGRLWPLNTKKTKTELVEGATVFEPERGLHDNLIVMDYKSLYPSAIRAYNICWSSIINEEIPPVNSIIAPNNVQYTQHNIYEGIMPRILTKLYNKRVELKTAMKKATTEDEKQFYDNQQYAVKILLNSCYGYTGSVTSRLYDARLANSVTSVGRMAIALTKKTAESLVKCKVVGGDTDSVFIKLFGVNDPDTGKKMATIIHDEMLKKLPPPMEIDFECYVKRAILFEKKRYAMLTCEQSKDGWKDKYKYRGIEVRRRDWVKLVGETMDKIFHLILHDGDVQSAWQHSNQVLNDVLLLKDIRTNTELADKLILSRKIGNLASYKNVQPHVTVYNKIVSRGEQPPGLGDRIAYMALPGALKDGISLNVDTPDHILETDGRIDNHWYVENQIKPPLERVFNAIGIDMLTGKKKLNECSLFGFKEGQLKVEDVIGKKEVRKAKTGLFAFGSG